MASTISPAAADSSRVIDLTEGSPTMISRSPTGTQTHSESALPSYGSAGCTSLSHRVLQTPSLSGGVGLADMGVQNESRRNDTDVDNSPINIVTVGDDVQEDFDNRQGASGTSLREIIDVDDLPDRLPINDGIVPNVRVNRHLANESDSVMGDIISVNTDSTPDMSVSMDSSPSLSAGADDITITHSRSRLPDPFTTIRRFHRLQMRNQQYSRSQSTTTNDIPDASGNDSILSIDLDGPESEHDTAADSSNRRRALRTGDRIQVGGGFGSTLSSTAAIVANDSRGRFLVPVEHNQFSINDETQRSMVQRQLPLPRPNTRALQAVSGLYRFHQLGRSGGSRRRYTGFSNAGPSNFEQPDLDYGSYLRDIYPQTLMDMSLLGSYEDHLSALDQFADVTRSQSRRGGSDGTISPDLPPPPRKGFTRRIRSGIRLVCPDCNAELGGPLPNKKDSEEVESQTRQEENDIQRTIWIARCGHVYCGKCAMKYRRQVRRSRKDSHGICVVPDCKQNICGVRGMFEIYV
ncbi:hypothetical protein V1511DRAFT_332884 [Dipodascopsis uninucleata]